MYEEKQILDLIKEFFQHSEGLRLGQFICNNLNITDNELFYSSNADSTIKILWAKYIRSETCNTV